MILRFADPWFLAALAVLPAVLWWGFARRPKSIPAAGYSDVSLARVAGGKGRGRWRPILVILRALALGVAIVALARPQTGSASREVLTEGIDIVLALDISGSMKAEDFKPKNRLYVAKDVIRDFVGGRISDRIGLVVFAAQAFTQCPLTLDYEVLTGFLKDVEIGMIDDGTAIGLGLATACARLRDSEAKSKIIVLLTDGVNNQGQIDPLTAAEIAKTLEVKVYTIGVGKPGNAPYPIDDPILGRRYVYRPNELDEESLTKIAEITGGQYYRADSPQVLEKVYNEISALERTEVKVKEYVLYAELFPWFLAAGLGLFMVEVLLTQLRFRSIP